MRAGIMPGMRMGMWTGMTRGIRTDMRIFIRTDMVMDMDNYRTGLLVISRKLVMMCPSTASLL
jgi:hypothetical protein